MPAIETLFRLKTMYDHENTHTLFEKAMKESILHHRQNNDFYKRLLEHKCFDVERPFSLDEVPLIPAHTFKTQTLLSIAKDDCVTKATSSGTEGQKSEIYLDAETIKRATQMAICAMKTHAMISFKPCHYLILGYEPSNDTTMGNVQLATAMRRFAPSLDVTYVFKWIGNRYVVDHLGVMKALKRFSRSPFPVRIMGFPVVLYELLQTMDLMEWDDIKLRNGSWVLTGGGWKQSEHLRMDSVVFRRMIHKRLGIEPEYCRDFYSAVEHSVAYPECSNHHMHVPVWSRVFVRDVYTLKPLPFDKPGFLNFVSPLVHSMPLSSVLMGDIGVLRDGKGCGCGVKTPYFEVLGRMNAIAMKGCALSASEILKGVDGFESFSW